MFGSAVLEKCPFRSVYHKSSFFISCMKSSLFQRLDWHHVFRQTNGDIVPAFAFLSCHMEYNWRDSAIPWWTSSLCFSFVALAAELSSLAFKHSWYRLGCWCLRWWNKLDISRISILLTSCAPCMLSWSVLYLFICIQNIPHQWSSCSFWELNLQQ